MREAVLIGALAGMALLLWPARTGPPGGGRARSPARDGSDRSRAGAAGDPEGDVIPASRLAALGARLARVLGRDRARRRAEAAELQVVDGLAASLETGLPVARAVRLAVTDAGPAASRGDGAAWSALVRTASEGGQLSAAWQRLARHAASPALASVARAWRVSELTGAPLASALRVSAVAARERARLARAVEVAVAGPRATVTVLTLLPLAGVGLSALLGVGPGALYGHPVAQAAVGCGAVLLLLGQVWVRRLVGRVLRGTA